MVQIRNTSPRGALEVPLLGRGVDAGEVVDVKAEHAARLLQQEDQWQRVTRPAARRPSTKRSRPAAAATAKGSTTEGDVR